MTRRVLGGRNVMGSLDGSVTTFFAEQQLENEGKSTTDDLVFQQVSFFWYRSVFTRRWTLCIDEDLGRIFSLYSFIRSKNLDDLEY
jgi:hypothetical protein